MNSVVNIREVLIFNIRDALILRVILLVMSEDKPRYSVKSPGRGGKRKGAGRPPVESGYTKSVTPRLTKEQYDWLSATAAARGVSMADVVRELITAAMGEGQSQ